MAEKSPFLNLHHIGVVVRDMDRVTKYYESLGLGPFEPVGSGVKRLEQKMLGKHVDILTLITPRIGRVGQIKMELIQPLGGESLWQEFLDTKGEGVHHLAFYVDDINKEEAKLVERGLPILFHLRFQGGGGAAYFDTRKFGGFITEIVHWAPGMITV